MSTAPIASNNYRGTTLGMALLDALDELVVEGKITTHLAMKILEEFDQSAVKHFAAARGKAAATGYLHTYRQVDDVWTLNVKDAKFHMGEGAGPLSKTTVESARVKIVAQKSDTAPADSKRQR